MKQRAIPAEERRAIAVQEGLASKLGGPDTRWFQLRSLVPLIVFMAGIPMSAVLPELFPTNTRYTGSGVAYNFSAILGAALTPFVAVWLVQHYSVAHVGYYLAAMSVLTIIALVLAPETSKKSLYT